MQINHYQNAVSYVGKNKNLRKVFRLWKEMEREATTKSKGTLPAFITGQYDYLSDIEVCNNYIAFTSKFSPNEEVLLLIANECQVDYVHQYYNEQYLLYGVNVFADGKLNEFAIENEDYLLYDIQPDGRFKFENKSYYHRLQIFEKMINRKIFSEGIPPQPGLLIRRIPI